MIQFTLNFYIYFLYKLSKKNIFSLIKLQLKSIVDIIKTLLKNSFNFKNIFY